MTELVTLKTKPYAELNAFPKIINNYPYLSYHK